MADVDMNLLRALDVLLSEGTVAGAARRMGLSESAMSRSLARLRAVTGDPLLVRAGRGLVPTPHAAALRMRVRTLAEEVHAVLRPTVEGLDIATLERTFVIRTNEGFVDAFAAKLITASAAEAPHVRLHFVPKPDKDIRPLREGLIDLEVGVLGVSGPEMRVQALFRDRFVGVVRSGHPLLSDKITPERYAACGHVVAARNVRRIGPVDKALELLDLRREIVAVVPGFPAALAVARASDLVALVTMSFLGAEQEHQSSMSYPGIQSFPLPVRTDAITVSQTWHPRMDADPAHRWLRGLLLAICRG